MTYVFTGKVGIGPAELASLFGYDDPVDWVLTIDSGSDSCGEPNLGCYSLSYMLLRAAGHTLAEASGGSAGSLSLGFGNGDIFQTHTEGQLGPVYLGLQIGFGVRESVVVYARALYLGRRASLHLRPQRVQL